MEQRYQEIDTRQYETHHEWCQFLANRGQLASQHRACRHTPYCVASSDRVVVKKIKVR